MALNLTSYAAKTFLDTSGTWYGALHSADSGQEGANNELSGLGYARVAITFTSASLATRTKTNSGIYTWGPATGAGWTVVWFSIWDAISGGNCWWQGPISNQVIPANDSYRILDAGLTIRFPSTANP